MIIEEIEVLTFTGFLIFSLLFLGVSIFGFYKIYKSSTSFKTEITTSGDSLLRFVNTMFFSITSTLGVLTNIIQVIVGP